ncbi:major facilitator superfamily domain-containing protein [Dissophora ornata]|nr:hypothetical protein BGZ58_002474 [Dissophora ornata]KAI8595151.1 major facilitator superfamily domain-containing protein [Dissophora ornata]
MVSQAMRQIILIGVICFGTIGMFNAMSSIGNAGKHSPTAQNLVVTSSSIAYIVGFLLAGGVHNMLGPRPCVGFGGFTFFLYAGAMMLAKDNEHSLYPPLAGILLGLGAGCIWVTQGAMMMSYPTEGNKGKYIACFWAIFNLGAVLGSVLPLIMNNAPSADPDDVSNSTYVVYMIIMGLATFLAVFLVRPSSIVRDNGEPIIVAKFSGIKAEFVAILSVFCDWRMLLLIPAFFFSNFSYTYQFNDFNGTNFNIRTRSLNSILFWVAQIIGALLIGHLMDRLPMKRPRRALLGLVIIAVLFMATWVGALMMQLKHKWQRKAPSSDDNNSNLIDYEHGDSYPVPLAVYAMFGFCDAAFAVYCYWLMGALSNKHDELSRYAGFFKSIQSLGSAVAAPLDLAQTPLLAYLITNWILCAFSLAAMFLVCRTITDTTLDNSNDDEEEYEDEDEDYEDYEDEDEDYEDETDARCARSSSRQEPGRRRQRSSVNRSGSFDGNLSTICATSEGGKTACGSRTSEQRSGCWRSNSRLQDYDDKDLEDPYSPPKQASGLCSHDSYMSSATAVSSRSKRRTSSVLSSVSITDPTTCPSPSYQHPHQHIKKSASRLSRVQPMTEIRDGALYSAQHLSVPQTQGPSRIPSISLTTDGASGARSGIGSSTTTAATEQSGSAPTLVFSHEFAPSLPPLPSMPSGPSVPLYPPQPQHHPYMFSSWATGPPSQAPGLPTTNADLPPHDYLAPNVHQAVFGGAMSASSMRYDEEQDMDSVDTCSLSSMSSAHDSIAEMGDMAPEPDRRHPHPRP